MRKLIIFGVIILAVLIPCCNYVVPTFGDYSDGVREGIVQKFSHKGWIYKTFEGELAMEGLKNVKTEEGNSISSLFEFSVVDQNVIAALDTLIGKRVKLHYTEKLHTNLTDGETDYFIIKVEPVK